MNRLSRIVLMSAVMAVVSFASFSTSSAAACDTCCKPDPVCCCPPPPPPPVMIKLCVVDPCTGCTYEECICIPACCVGEAPCMTWKKGLFGRKVLTYTWKCCDHCVDVVITKRGKTIVRD